MQTINLLHHHAHLWLGSTQTLEDQIIQSLQKIVCPAQGCRKCITCKQIEQQEHAWIHWLKPEGSYAIDQIDEILQLVRFKLAPQEHRFIIFSHAEELTSNCNNRLLKAIEEPHPGYIFIFLASRTENILPTLQSRCFLQEFSQTQNNYSYQEILQPFLQNKFEKPQEFMKNIDSFEIKERETKEIIDFLITAFYTQLKSVDMHATNHQSRMIQITEKIVLLKQALLQLPVQGSAKMFWKNLYLKFHQQQ